MTCQFDLWGAVVNSESLRLVIQVPHTYLTDLHSGHQCLVSFPDWRCCVHVVTHCCWKKYALLFPPLGENSWKLAPGFSWTLSHAHFTFTNFTLHSSAVIICNHVCDSFSEFCEPSSESALKVVLRLLGTLPNSPPAHDLISMKSGITFVCLVFLLTF